MGLRRISVYAVIIFVLIAVVLICHFGYPAEISQGASEPSGRESKLLPGEEFIRRHMINGDGTLRTNLQPHVATDRNIAKGEEALSESIGLWMLYAVEKGDRPLFEQNVEVLKEKFLKKEGWIYWKLGPEPVTTNALIDDLRIAEALYKAYAIWQSAEYRDLANLIAQSVVKRQVVDGRITDFYDDHSKWTSNVLTLSYINATALAEMDAHGHLPEGVYEGTIRFLHDLPVRNGFFPFSYHVQDKTFLYHDQINLIDQLYIVYHRAQAEIPSPEMWSFLKEEFAKRGFLYGRYRADTKQPAVEFESPAVYGLAILAAVELNDGEFAKDLYYRMIRHQTLNPESEQYGGYTHADDTHIFDNLIPLLAERKMYNGWFLR